MLISSNGLLLTSAIIQKLASYPDLKISISLDGPVAEIHENIRGQGTYKRTIEAISGLTNSGVFVGVNMFVHEGNINLIEDTIRLADTVGVRAFNCINLLYVGRANSRQSQRKLVRVAESILYQKLFLILKDNTNYQEMMQNSTFANQIMGIAGGVKSHYCGIGTNRALYVMADGNIYPCPHTAVKRFCLGNARNENLKDIWEKSQILKDLRLLDVDKINAKCASCDVRYFCGGSCRGENYQVTKEIQSPHFNCAEIRKTILEMMWMLTEEPEFFRNKVESLYQTVCD
jgi:mycofactocin biosynthetic radical S-adenosylmethionine protein MftC